MLPFVVMNDIVDPRWICAQHKFSLRLGSDDVLMELPITEDILHLTSFVCNVLSQPGRNLLLCGTNGSGRTESMHIGCSFLQIKVFSPIPVKNYKIEDFYNDLRMVILRFPNALQ